ncbi:MAG TPA: hypothetical protein VLJ39_07360 [Tepidisphaeraceae bacterium]|jgi:hypothetical protein|nr:hypothetical protein [Tepidisphaeraceae bacterium]
MEEEANPPEPLPERNAPGYNKGDLLHQEWSEAPSWFGYIGVGIAVVSLGIGIVGMVFVIRFIIGWLGS